jgi:hypothetical protein
MYKDYLILIIILLILNIFIYLLFKFLKKKKFENRCLGYHRETKNIDLPYKIVFSLTTTPHRINQISHTLNTLVNQTVKPNYILLNIPHKFNRTNEYYKIPQFLNYYDNLIINKLEKDYGPITKLLGAIKYIPKDEDTWIIICDDDDLYLQETLEYYIKYIQKKKDSALSISGFNMLTSKDFFKNQIEVKLEYPKRDLSKINVLEGFATFAVHRSFFDDDFIPYVEFCIQNKDCKMSDDIIISNYLGMKNIPIYKIVNMSFNKEIFWNSECVLEVGFQNDALHKIALQEDGKENNSLLGGHYQKYVRVLNFLHENNILFIK